MALPSITEEVIFTEPATCLLPPVMLVLKKKKKLGLENINWLMRPGLWPIRPHVPRVNFQVVGFLKCEDDFLIPGDTFKDGRETLQLLPFPAMQASWRVADRLPI